MGFVGILTPFGKKSENEIIQELFKIFTQLKLSTVCFILQRLLWKSLSYPFQRYPSTDFVNNRLTSDLWKYQHYK